MAAPANYTPATAVHDRRIRALVLLAPVGALFTDEALSNLAVPVRASNTPQAARG